MTFTWPFFEGILAECPPVTPKGKRDCRGCFETKAVGRFRESQAKLPRPLCIKCERGVETRKRAARQRMARARLANPDREAAFSFRKYQET